MKICTFENDLRAREAVSPVPQRVQVSQTPCSPPRLPTISDTALFLKRIAGEIKLDVLVQRLAYE